MIRTILFASDFSELSTRAEAYTVELAKKLSASVEVMHAVEPIAGADGDDELDAFTAELRGRCEARLEEAVARLRTQDVEASSFLTTGAPWVAIVERAAEIGADLVVLGSHGLREAGRVYVGTTSHRVLFNTTVPVLVVRPEGDD
jgi:nucleotide-binding universal stress UspA family protein